MQSLVDCALSQLNISNDNFIGCFLYGSQNYQLDNESSDIDTILLIRNHIRTHQEMAAGDGKIKIYTLPHFLQRLRRGDLECYEILYTQYRIINPIYEELFNTFVAEFSQCMNYERIKNALSQKLNEHIAHILWMSVNPDKAKYNKKRLYWAIRVYTQLQQIEAGMDFKTSLIYTPIIPYDLRSIKTVTNYLSLKDFNEIYRNLINYNRALPRYSNEILNIEKQCLYDFEASIAAI